MNAALKQVIFIVIMSHLSLVSQLRLFVFHFTTTQEVSPPAAAREELWTPIGRVRGSGGAPNVAVWRLRGRLTSQSQLQLGQRANHRMDGRGSRVVHSQQTHGCTLNRCIVFPLFFGFCLHGHCWTLTWQGAKQWRKQTLYRENQRITVLYSQHS